VPKTPEKLHQPTQRQRFSDAARDAGCPDDDGAFDRALKRVASAPPPKSVEKRKDKKLAKQAGSSLEASSGKHRRAQ
jgi:hypothetical protein